MEQDDSNNVSTGASPKKGPTGFRVRMERVEGNSGTGLYHSDEPAKVDRFELIYNAAEHFREGMTNLWRYAEGVGTAAYSTGFVNLAELAHLIAQLAIRDKDDSRQGFAKFVVEVKYGVESEEGEWVQEAEYPVRDAADMRRCRELISSSDCAITLLHQTTLQQAVVHFERLLGEMVFHATLADPKNTYETESIAVQDLLGMNSFDQAKEAIAYRQTETFLREPTEKKLKYLQNTLKVDLYRICKKQIAPLCECIIRRHAIVHGTSFSSHWYWDKRSKIKGLPPADRKESVDTPSVEYIVNAWQVFYSAGVIAVHALMHRIAIEPHDEETRRTRVGRADSYLNHASYECINLRRYDAAEDILRYFLDDHRGPSDVDSHRLMAKVNLAQTLKWTKRDSDCQKELDRIDLGSLNDTFQLCVAALKEDHSEFGRLLPKVAAEDQVTLPQLLEWPVFKAMRKADNFKELVGHAFNVDPTDIPDTKRIPLVLGPTPDRVEKVVKKLNARAENLRGKDKDGQREPPNE